MLKLKQLRDYAIIMVNGKRVGVLDRRLNQDSLSVTLPAGQVTLDILVENLGRVNFGKYLLQNKKGITESVWFNGSEVQNWKMYGLPFDNTTAAKFTQAKVSDQAPVIRKGRFDLETVADTYLDMSNWGKGVVWVNGHNLGRLTACRRRAPAPRGRVVDPPDELSGRSFEKRHAGRHNAAQEAGKRAAAYLPACAR